MGRPRIATSSGGSTAGTSHPPIWILCNGPPMRVAHVVTDAGPHPYFRAFLEHSSDQVTLDIGSVGPAGALQEEMRAAGVSTFALGASSRTQLPLAPIKLARHLRATRSTVVQGHLLDGYLVGLLAARVARRPLAIYTAHH